MKRTQGLYTKKLTGILVSGQRESSLPAGSRRSGGLVFRTFAGRCGCNFRAQFLVLVGHWLEDAMTHPVRPEGVALIDHGVVDFDRRNFSFFHRHFDALAVAIDHERLRSGRLAHAEVLHRGSVEVFSVWIASLEAD